MDFENSQTKKNLETAFAGESQAHTKYRYYSSQAKKDGYVQISDIFMETAKNESEHAKLWFKYLHGGAVPGTLDNLKDAAAGENCGHLHVGPTAPQLCPVCNHPQSYFEEQAINY